MLRFYEDLPPREIARRIDVNAATVRTRLKRGLDLMRGRLDRDYGGDRRAWCLALIPLMVPQAKAATAAGVTGGVLIMSSKTNVSIAAVLLLAGLAAVWGVVAASKPSERAEHSRAASRVAL